MTGSLRRLTIVVTALFLVAACNGDSIYEGGTSGPDAPRELALRLELAANLEPFGDCEELLGYFEESAREIAESFEVTTDDFVGPEPVVGAPVEGRDVTAGAAEADAQARDASGIPGVAAESADSALATSGPPATGGPVEFSGTNIQEREVDEPDLVKTDGERIVAVSQNRLFVVVPEGSGTRVVGSVTLPAEGSHEIFLHQDRVIVLTRSYYAIALGAPEVGGNPVADYAAPTASTTVVTAVDISDPSAPTVANSATFEGDYVSARLHEGVVRLVLTSYPGGYFAPADIEGTDIDDWLPNAVEGADPESSEATDLLVPCDAVARPPEPSGTGTVTVLTIDAAGSMEPIDTDAVVADAQTVYASTQTLYVATNQWHDPRTTVDGSATTTELHAFDISEPDRTTYLASGRVRGQLLNQWSLSEHEGNLRVATTDGSPWGPADGQSTSESFMSVLRPDGDRLAIVGQVGGLGKGETIQSVRYIGTIGFVVTFRQTDPLYALDLSDPTSPRVVGELKVPGFSAYLHPIEGDRLLGVGQDATEDGVRIGTQVSLFDISDVTDLKRLDNATIENASSSVEFDAKAFLWWAQRELALVPVDIYGPPTIPEAIEPVPVSPDSPVAGGDAVAEPSIGIAPSPPVDVFSGLVAFRVEGGNVDETARITHQDRAASLSGVASDPYYGGPQILRAIVVGASLYTFSDVGIMASDLASFAEQAFAAFS